MVNDVSNSYLICVMMMIDVKPTYKACLLYKANNQLQQQPFGMVNDVSNSYLICVMMMIDVKPTYKACLLYKANNQLQQQQFGMVKGVSKERFLTNATNSVCLLI